jgi:hypothetical protein
VSASRQGETCIFGRLRLASQQCDAAVRTSPLPDDLRHDAIVTASRVDAAFARPRGDGFAALDRVGDEPPRGGD